MAWLNGVLRTLYELNDRNVTDDLKADLPVTFEVGKFLPQEHNDALSTGQKK